MIRTESFELAEYAQGNSGAEKLALVLPGRLDTKDYPHMRSHVDFLAGLGYYAISFDPPGTWESPGGIEIYTMSNYLKAMQEIISLYENRPTLLVGHSRGGSMAMLGGTTIDQVTAFAAIMSNPSASVPPDEYAYVEKGVSESYRDEPFGDGQRRFDLPASYFEDAAQYDMREDLAACAKPKLFIFGEQDVLVKSENVKAMYEAAADPKQLAGVSSEHDYRKHPEIIDEVNALIGDWLR